MKSIFATLDASTREDVLSIAKLKTTVLLFTLSAVMLVNTSCDDPSTGTGPEGGGPGTDPSTKNIVAVSGGANKDANFVMYNAAASTFTVSQFVTEGQSEVSFKIVDNNVTGPALDTLGITSNGSLLDYTQINPDLASGSVATSLVKGVSTKDLSIKSQGYYIGDAVSNANKKLTDFTYSGVGSFGIENGKGATVRENVENMREALKAVKNGEKKLQLVGNTANGYDGTFTNGTAFTIGKLSPK